MLQGKIKFLEILVICCYEFLLIIAVPCLSKNVNNKWNSLSLLFEKMHQYLLGFRLTLDVKNFNYIKSLSENKFNVWCSTKLHMLSCPSATTQIRYKLHVLVKAPCDVSGFKVYYLPINSTEINNEQIFHGPLVRYPRYNWSTAGRPCACILGKLRA